MPMARIGPRFVHVPPPNPLSWIRQALLRAFGRPHLPDPAPIETLLTRLDEDE
jgi:hypothetical protein